MKFASIKLKVAVLNGQYEIPGAVKAK